MIRHHVTEECGGGWAQGTDGPSSQTLHACCLQGEEAAGALEREFPGSSKGGCTGRSAECRVEEHRVADTRGREKGTLLSMHQGFGTLRVYSTIFVVIGDT